MSYELVRTGPLRSYLFAPGNNQKLLGKVFAAGADAVVLDLEDAVPPAEKQAARALVAQTVAGSGTFANSSQVFVRVNGLESGLTEMDIALVVHPLLAGIRLPKVEGSADVTQVAALLAEAETKAKVRPGTISIDCTIESARGVVAAVAIAAAHPRVRTLIFGQADFCLDIGVDASPDNLETLYARSALVVASRAAGLAPPIDGAYTTLRDPEGLFRNAARAKALGFYGKSALHPEQLAVIHEVFSPSESELAWAGRVLEAWTEAETRGTGALRLQDGQFVDEAVARRARQILERAGQSAAVWKETKGS